MTNIRRWTTTLTSGLQAKEADLPFHLFSLVLGFFLGNLFGMFLGALRAYLPSDLLIILFLCAAFEYISFLAYANTGRGWRLARRTLNLMKIGCLFGFFVDAFKVGS